MNYTSGNTRKPRVFIDANTLVSGLFFEGAENKLLNMGLAGTIELITCDFVIEEVKEVTRRKFPEKTDTVTDVLELITIVDAGDISRAKEMIRDKKDAPVLAAAIKHQPDYFVTGDNDFHNTKIKEHVNVVKTREFLDTL